MKFKRIHNKGQARLFENKHLEYLTKTHSLVIWGSYLPLICFMLYLSKTNISLRNFSMMMVFSRGMLFWSFFEYLIHRYGFHYAAKTKRAEKIVYIIHGNHHEYPRDKERLFMPPVPSLVTAALIFFLMYFTGYLLKLDKYVFVFFAGFLLGY